jgi:uncharacterized protein (DUF58 family)
MMKVTPTRQTFLLGLVLVAMWYAAVSQGNNMAYLIGFILLSVSITSTLSGWDNLRKIRVAVQPASPVFAGERAKIPVHFTNDGRKYRYNLGLLLPASPKRWETASLIADAVEGRDWVEKTLEVPMTHRGEHRIEQVTLRSDFPLGILRVSRGQKCEGRVLVYPRPAGNKPVPRGESLGTTQSEGPRAEGDEFSGVRAYRSGESERHVDWKAVARGAPKMIKLFTGGGDERVWLEWEQLEGLPEEARLSQLARWVVKAERENMEYGLKIPGTRLAPTNGANHYHQCLAALARFKAGG